jgi:phage terminase small subunit
VENKEKYIEANGPGLMLKIAKHERFCHEYIKDCNATQSYLRAGYKCSEECARKASSRLLTKVDIKNRVAELEKEVSTRNTVETDEIIGGYKRLLDICGDTVEVEIGRGKKKAKKMILVDAKNYKGALDSLARINSMFKDKVDVKHSFEELLMRRKNRT